MVVPRSTLGETLRHPLVLGSIVLALWSIPWALGGASVIVDGQRYFFLADDPTISLRYGRNFANGLGLVWNAGEHVEGYSNFLWTIYMAVLHRLPIPTAEMALAVIATNVGVAVVGMWLVYKLSRRLAPDASVALFVVAAYALNGDLFEWMIRGFETSIMATVLLACFVRLIADSDAGRPRVWTYLLIASLALIRTDGLILAGPLLLLGVLTTPDRRRAIVWSAFALLLPAAHLTFRWFYYGDLLPNTAYLKIFGYAGRLLSGVRWTFKFYASYPVAALLVVTALIRFREWPLRAGAALCLLFSVYTIYVGGDSFDGFRFLAPIIPLFLVVAFAAGWRIVDAAAEARVAALANRLGIRDGVGIALGLVGFAVFVAAALSWPERGQERLLRQSAISFVGAVGLGLAVWAAARSARLAAPARLALLAFLLADMPLVLWSHRHPAPWGPAYPDNVRMGLFLKATTAPDATIGDSWAGIPAYFSGRRGVDFLGKCEPHVARMPAASRGTVPGHNKFDYDYSLGQLRPDYVVASFKLPVTDAEMEEDARGDYAFIGRLYFNEIFRSRCLPHPVAAPPELRRTVFQCDWSGAAITPR